MRNKFPSIILMLFVTAGVAWAQERDAQQIEKELMRSYKNRVLILREFHSGNHLEYDAQGQFLKGGEIGPWTLDGKIEVSGIQFGHDALEIKGKRHELIYDAEKKEFKTLRTKSVRVEIGLVEPMADIAIVERVLWKVFLSPGEELADFVPSFWRTFMGAKANKDSQPAESSSDAAGGENPPATAPILVRGVAPDFSNAARNVRFQGVVILDILVDEHGDVREIELQRPLGLGLDENAAEAVSKWKYKPSMRGGVPCPMRVRVEVIFRRYV